jgi:hypothetical protein
VTLGFFTLNSPPGAEPLGTLALVGGSLVETGCAGEFTSARRKRGMTDAEILDTLGHGWSNGYFYTKPV